LLSALFLEFEQIELFSLFFPVILLAYSVVANTQKQQRETAKEQGERRECNPRHGADERERELILF
jgi:hypothetical protein